MGHFNKSPQFEIRVVSLTFSALKRMVLLLLIVGAVDNLSDFPQASHLSSTIIVLTSQSFLSGSTRNRHHLISSSRQITLSLVVFTCKSTNFSTPGGSYDLVLSGLIKMTAAQSGDQCGKCTIDIGSGFQELPRYPY